MRNVLSVAVALAAVAALGCRAELTRKESSSVSTIQNTSEVERDLRPKIEADRPNVVETATLALG